MSEPYERDITTRILNSILASHTPNVIKIILICGNIRVEVHDINGINRTKHSIILSKQNRDIRKCENWIISATVVAINAINVNKIKDVEYIIELR